MLVRVFIFSRLIAHARGVRGHFFCVSYLSLNINFENLNFSSLSLTLLDARVAMFYSSSLKKSSSSASESKPSHCKGSGQPLLLANSKQSAWP